MQFNLQQTPFTQQIFPERLQSARPVLGAGLVELNVWTLLGPGGFVCGSYSLVTDLWPPGSPLTPQRPAGQVQRLIISLKKERKMEEGQETGKKGCRKDEEGDSTGENSGE